MTWIRFVLMLYYFMVAHKAPDTGVPDTPDLIQVYHIEVF